MKQHCLRTSDLKQHIHHRRISRRLIQQVIQFADGILAKTPQANDAAGQQKEIIYYHIHCVSEIFWGRREPTGAMAYRRGD